MAKYDSYFDRSAKSTATVWLALFLGRFVAKSSSLNDQGPVVQKPINANPGLKINQGVYFSTPKCCSMLIFGKTLHKKKSILKNTNKQRNFHQKVEIMKQKFTLILD